MLLGRVRVADYRIDGDLHAMTSSDSFGIMLLCASIHSRRREASCCIGQHTAIRYDGDHHLVAAYAIESSRVILRHAA